MNQFDHNKKWTPSHEEWLQAQLEIDGYLQKKKNRRLILWMTLVAGLIGLYFLMIHNDSSGPEFPESGPTIALQDSAQQNEERQVTKIEAGLEEEEVTEALEAGSSFNEGKLLKSTTVNHGQEIKMEKDAQTGPQNEKTDVVIIDDHPSKAPTFELSDLGPSSSEVISANNRAESSKITGVHSGNRTQTKESMSGSELEAETKVRSSWVTGTLDNPLNFHFTATDSSFMEFQPTAIRLLRRHSAVSWKWRPMIGMAFQAMEFDFDKGHVQSGAEASIGVQVFNKKGWGVLGSYALQAYQMQRGVTHAHYHDRPGLGANFDQWLIEPELAIKSAFRIGALKMWGKHQVNVYGQVGHLHGAWSQVEKNSYDELSFIQNGQGRSTEELGRLWTSDIGIQKWSWQTGISYNQKIGNRVNINVGIEYDWSVSNHWAPQDQRTELRGIDHDAVSPVNLIIGLIWTL